MSSIAGKVLLIPKGTYDSSVTYEVLDWVLYNGRPYVAKQTTTGNLPTNTTYWSLLLDFPTEVDNVPTQNSNNLVKSGGVYAGLDGKIDKASGYQTTDGAETIADADYVPFYDSSNSAPKKTLWSSIKSVLTAAFTGASSGTAGTSGDVPAPAAGDEGKFLKGNGTWDYPTTPSDMTGATALSDGTHGLIIAPQAGDEGKFFKGNGTWADVPNPSVMTGATTSTPGTSGLTPAPAAGDNTKFLRGDGTYAIAGDVYYEKTVTLSTSGVTAVSFTDATVSNLPTNATYALATSINNMTYTDLECATAGTVTVNLPKWTSAANVTLRLYVKYAAT